MMPGIHAELKDLHSPDALDLTTYIPEDPTCFSLLVEASIGVAGGKGADIFSFIVCTPAWVEHLLDNNRHLWGHHYLLLSRYDYRQLEGIIRHLCVRAEGPDWDSVARFLARYGAWEFEDYRESL